MGNPSRPDAADMLVALASTDDGAATRTGRRAKRQAEPLDAKAAPAQGEAPSTAAPSTAAEPPTEPVKRKRGRRKLIHDEEERKLRRKMQCKLNQRRYRARQRGMITSLSLDTEKTTDNIQELEAYHRFLGEFDEERTAVAASAEHVADRRPLMVVNQFTQLFRHGFALHSVEVSEIQENFLRFAMDPLLHSQGAVERGVDALILQLKRYSSYHAVFEVLTESVEVVDEQRPGPTFQRPSGATPLAAVVHVSGKLHLRISRDTVMLLYPHIIEDEELNMRVVGQEIYPTFSMVFYFNELAKVAKFEFAVDFASAFMQLLRNAELTSRLLERAIITPHGELGVDPHGAFDSKPDGNKQLSLKFILL